LPILEPSGRYRDTKIELRTRADNPLKILKYVNTLNSSGISGETLERFKNAEQVSEACPVYNCHVSHLQSQNTDQSADFSILEDDGF